MIQFGQKLHLKGESSVWNHVALVADTNGGIIESLTRGVQFSQINKYDGFKKKYVHFDLSNEDRSEVVNYARHCLNDSYGWLDFFSAALHTLINSKLVVYDGGETICSVLVAKALEHGSIILKKDAASYSPADLYNEFGNGK